MPRPRSVASRSPTLSPFDMAPPVIPGVNIALLAGPMVLGFLWSFALYGILIVQVYIYFQLYPKDRIAIKWLVWITFFFDTVFIVFQMIAAWYMFGSGWGDPDRLLAFNWSWMPLVVLNGLLAGIAQGFYTWRIWKLTTGIRWLPILISCMILLQMASTTYFGVKIRLLGQSVEELHKVQNEILLWLSADLVADNLITISLVTILLRRRSKAQVRQTAGLINKLIRFAIETGTVTSLGAILELVLWLTCSQWNFHFILFHILGRLYTNGLMATLNCRAPLVQPSRGGPLHIHTTFWSDVEDPEELVKPRLAVTQKAGSSEAGSTTLGIDNNENDEYVLDITLQHMKLPRPRP
ncbi:hypothetical protein R3P38DRAFT_2971892 [Favolaschia claudopus]|uniref:DUF6534 domain-containing protein n=1 Tax=Favolaschia claudopus TaxID=2862362 RepID=A0AAW0B3T2_9AGAR